MSSQSFKDDRNAQRQHRLEEMYDALDAVLWDFQWTIDGGNNLGEIDVDRENNKLHLQVWVRNSDEPEDEIVHPLDVTIDVDPYQDPKQQIRELIHWHLAHEADEQMYFKGERPFYPHDAEGQTIQV